MKKTMSVLVSVLYFIGSYAFACPKNPFISTVPMAETRENPILGEMTEEIFDDALNRVEDYYSKKLSPLGVTFSVQSDYESDYNNAHPEREGFHWFIKMYGGYFRNKPYETFETVAIVACHEVGHHLGETAYYSGSYHWASAEGQSDYFSTLKCMRHILKNEDNIAWVENYPLNIPSVVTTECNQVWEQASDIALCIRSAMASFQRAYNKDENVSFFNPDKKIVGKTAIAHPNPQCRLDTRYQGALCIVSENIDHDKDNEITGNCNSAEHSLGLRPACWYKEPELTSLMNL